MNACQRQWFALALPFVLLPFVNGCGHSDAAPHSGIEPETPAFSLVRPERNTLVRIVEQPGQIEGFETTVLTAKISGYVKPLKFDIGDKVEKDQIVAELFVPEIEQEYQQKVAGVGQAEAEVTLSMRLLDAAEATIERSEANVKLAEAGRTRAEASYTRWTAEMERSRLLVRRNALDQQTLDQATDQFKSSEAARNESEATIQAAKAAKTEAVAQRDKAAADVKVAQSKLKVSEADRDRVKANLDYAQIRAPYNGIIVKRHVDSGALLQTTSPGAGNMFTMVRTDPVRIFVDVPESEAVHVTRGMAATVRVQALDEREVTGTVARFSWALDQQQRTLHTQIDLPNANGRLRPGMYATARLSIAHDNLLTVPVNVVWTQDDQPMVLVVEANKLKRLPVKVGLRQNGSVQLLKKAGPSSARGAATSWIDFRGDEELVLTDSPGALPEGTEARPENGKR